MPTIRKLDALLEPDSIAVVGASRTPGKVGHDLVANLLAGGYDGKVFPVNPHAKEILGLPCYAAIRQVPESVDLALVALSAAQAAEGVKECGHAGVRSIIVLSAGFKEVGPEGAAAERNLAELCREQGIPLMGPNCIGLINTHRRLNATFVPAMPPVGGISIVSQSGALCVALLDWARTHGIGFAKVVSMGNKADLGEAEFLEALSTDDETKVIACYLESVSEGHAFMRAAELAATRKPVVILKAGHTKAGSRAAQSHTGSLTGANIAYGAAFRQAGVVQADTLEHLFDFAHALWLQTLPAGNRLLVLTNAGGPAILAADAAEQLGLTLPSLSEETRRRLAEVLPPAASMANPVDVLGDADPERFARVFDIVQDDDETDGLVVIATQQNPTRPDELIRRLAEGHRGKKPLLVALFGGEEVRRARGALRNLGIPCFPAPERAVAAFKALHDYASWRRRKPRVVTRFPVNRRRVERILGWHDRMETRQVGEVEAKEILRAYQFHVLEGHLVRTAAEATKVATRIGFPVVMKIVSPDIMHKSDIGGVRLNLGDPDEVRDAFDLMMLRVQRTAPHARIRGAYVERMVRRGREVILGMVRDPSFGPTLMFGVGGIFVEVMRDVSFHLAPITAEEARQMLEETRSYQILKGARGQAPVDVDAIAGGLQRISQLATDYPQIVELDINPFMVSEVGTDAYVADARMTLCDTNDEESAEVKR